MFKILIVEDEDIIRKGLAYTIDWVSLGYVVVGEAENGEEGLQKIRSLQPDVVIADIKMPKMDGITMLQTALQEQSFQSIILTSYAEFEYARQAISLGVHDYIMKPVDEEHFMEIMRQLHAQIVQEKEAALAVNRQDSGLDISYYMELARSENQYVAGAISRIQKQYAEKLGVEGIAGEMGISPSYLSRKFKDITGHTFLDFLNQYRVQQAVKLLYSGQYKIYEISDMTGFGDYKHFCSVFKKYTLTSPTGFLKQ